MVNYIFKLLKLKGLMNRIKLLIKRKRKENIRKEIYVDICTICNARCLYCLHQYRKLVQPHLMNKSTFIFIAEILRKEGFQFVRLFMSGEPFLHPDLPEFITILAKKKIDIGISTKLAIPINFELLDQALSTADLMKQNVDFEITVDTINPNTQLKIAPGIKTELVLDNLKQMAKLRNSHNSFKYSCISVVNRFNEGELDNVQGALRNLGFTNWTPKQMGYFMGYIATKDDLALASDLLPLNKNYRQRYKVENDTIASFKEKCPLPNVPAISYDGNITVCCHDMLHLLNFGNVLEQKSIDKVLTSKQFRKAKKAAEKMSLRICEACN